MKNISILFCAFLLATTTLVGCDNFGDEDKNEPTTCYFGGWIDLQKIPTITKETFKRQIVGKGWKHVFTQEMNANGTIEQKSYYKGLIGINPIDFYFSEGSVTSFIYSDALNENIKTTKDYIYDEAFRTRCAHHGLKKAQAVLETGRMMHEAEADRQIVCVFLRP